MEAGTQLGNYVIKDRLGRGATAEVFRALQPTIDRDVAIKVMFPHLTDSPDFSARFQREARSMGQLQHPNIGRIIDFEASGERPYMVMEHLVGGSLQELMQASGGPLPVRFALQVTRQLGDALRYAHSMGMIHRDIKPANVMFTDDTHQCAMLMDFGMARLVDESMTATGAILGTPAFMAPEQMRGEVAGAPADMYSLGVMLYEMVTGRPLYEADSVHTLMMKHVEAPIPSARASAPNVSEGLDALLQTTLAKQPGDRFSDAGELVAAIDGLLGSSTIDGSGRSRDTVMQAGAAGPHRRGNAKGSGPSRAGLLGALVAVAIIAAGMVFALTRGGDDPDPEAVTVASAATDNGEADNGEAVEPVAQAQFEPTTEATPSVETAETAVPEPDPAPATVDPAVAARAGFDATSPPPFFATSAQMDGDEFVLAWDRTRPSRTEYRVNIDSASAPLGPLEVDADGRGVLRVTAPAHLASVFTVTSVDPATGETVDVAYENSMSTEARAMFDRRLALVSDIERELAIAVDHMAFIGDELANGDLNAARRHTEHVINIIDGADGPLFGDLDASGLAENPGDGVGVLAYATTWNDDAGTSNPDQQIVSLASADLVATQTAGVRVLSSDSVDEATRAFDGLSDSLAVAARGLERAEVALHSQAVQTLIGPALQLTGTDTSAGTISALTSSGQILISTTQAVTGREITVRTSAGDIAIPATGFATVDAPSGVSEFGDVTLIDADGEPFGNGALSPVALTVFEQLAAVDTGVLAQLDAQAQIVADHADLMRQEVEAGNHTEVRRHAEHVVNIIVGEQNDTFGDLDGDGAAQNPGDGVGVLAYLDHVDELLAQLPAATIEQRFYAEAYRTSVAATREHVATANAEALRILATDSAPEAEPPMVTVLNSAIEALDGTDADGSGFIDIDETGIRGLTAQAFTLLSAPLEP